ncbi:MAG: alkaline phosphatase D family protein [Bacteroidia bacterium]|nr:alkaline phosphatase D family protein [Bacteroidia bacterium]
MKKSLLLLLLFSLLASCDLETQGYKFHLGQGIMIGEVSENSAILQARLTTSPKLIEDDMPGITGTGIFEVSPNEDFSSPTFTHNVLALKKQDYIMKFQLNDLLPDTRYYYRLLYGTVGKLYLTSKPGSFKTLAGAEISSDRSFVVVTGMNNYYFHYGKYNAAKAYKGADKEKGFPALEAIKNLAPDYFIGTGDNVYFDHPNQKGFKAAQERGDNPHPATYGGKAVEDEAGMRKKYHEQFSQQRFIELFRQVGTYWEKDDHDYRFNDADPFRDFPISHELGIKNFREQLPVVDPKDPLAKTYRKHRMNKELEVWFLEGRDYRSNNQDEPSNTKTIWGAEQKAWLKESLKKSDASFKIIISPTPMVGPDDAYKKDNHTNPNGFRQEGEAFFDWLNEEEFPHDKLFFICGDRHWQYHAKHPSGFEEFACGALVDNNSRVGRVAGGPKSTDPEALIKQFYIQDEADEASGGFLHLATESANGNTKLIFSFYDEKGELLYQSIKES